MIHVRFFTDIWKFIFEKIPPQSLIRIFKIILNTIILYSDKSFTNTLQIWETDDCWLEKPT